jgi:hypothetical protein
MNTPHARQERQRNFATLFQCKCYRRNHKAIRVVQTEKPPFSIPLSQLEDHSIQPSHELVSIRVTQWWIMILNQQQSDENGTA